MKNIKLIVIILVLVLLAAGAAGAGVWWMLKPKAGTPGAAAAAEASKAAEAAKPGPEYKYTTLDKVLVMLRNSQGESVPHYLSVDLVFKSLPDDEKHVKDQLPMLRTVAVKALSVYTMEAASALTVDQVAEALNKAYKASYAEEHHEPPFAQALIGKLIIE